LDAVRRLGVTASRVLLVGGAAANPAVSHIAAPVFDAPVELPEAGEFVAVGAAEQAAWALSGQRPHWQFATLARPTAAPVPPLRQQYAAHAAARTSRDRRRAHRVEPAMIERQDPARERRGRGRRARVHACW